MQISLGDIAPQFQLPTDGGGTFNLAEHGGRATVLFFYPKDDTSGCTREAIEFTELLDEFSDIGVRVAGISPDPVTKHDKFKAKYDLNVTLISDEEKSVLEAYGVWVEKSMYGRKYMGVNRTTLVIDANGKVIKAWHKVKVPDHVKEVVNFCKENFS